MLVVGFDPQNSVKIVSQVAQKSREREGACREDGEEAAPRILAAGSSESQVELDEGVPLQIRQNRASAVRSVEAFGDDNRVYRVWGLGFRVSVQGVTGFTGHVGFGVKVRVSVSLPPLRGLTPRFRRHVNNRLFDQVKGQAPGYGRSAL